MSPSLQTAQRSATQTPARAGDGFAADLREGLTQSPKSIPPKYFYDALGSLLFEAICALPEYPVTRAEAAILERHGGEIAAAVVPPGRPLGRVVELGSGSAKKTRTLLAALLARQPQLAYWPIDVSASALTESARELAHEFPGLEVHPRVADYPTGLAAVAERSGEEPTLVLFLGSSLGNLGPAEQRQLLRQVRAALAPGDTFLLGLDQRKPEPLMIAAYDDPTGVTAAFNKNLLARINRELGGTFDLTKFQHRAVWAAAESRIEMHLVATVAHTVAFHGGELDGFTVPFAAGEPLVTEWSYKFTPEHTVRLAADTGFRLARTWSDREGGTGQGEAAGFLENLLVAE